MARQDGDDRVVGGAPHQDTRHSHNATILDRRYNSAIILGDRQTDIFPPRRRPILQVDQRDSKGQLFSKSLRTPLQAGSLEEP